MNFNCPICGKAGLPDYKVTEVICPQCNTDLKAFYLLNNNIKSKSKNRLILPVVILGVCLFIASVFYFLNLSKLNNIVADNAKIIQQYRDSVNLYKSELHLTEKESKPDDSGKEIILRYKIKKGDNLIKIAKFFYNDHSKYKMIEMDNNLLNPYKLDIGKLLIIKYKQE